MSVQRKSLWKTALGNATGPQEQNGVSEKPDGQPTDRNVWYVTSLAIRAAQRLKAEGFTEYATPEKLTKFKEHLRNAEYVAFLPDDEVVVSDKVAGCIRIFNADGTFQKTLVNRIRPLGVTTNRSGMVAFVENRAGRDKFINVVASDNGKMFAKWGEDVLWKPRGIAMSNKGQLVISDTYKQKHQVGTYTMDGRCIHKFGSQGMGEREFDNPWYITVDPFDRIVVSDRDNHCIKIYDDHGTFLSKIGRQGSGDGSLHFPRGVCSDSKGNLLVCDSGNKRVSVFSSDGRFRQHLLSQEDGLVYPRAIALSRSSGHLAVTQHDSDADSNFRKVRIYQIEKL